jgi:AcrR family transcriptional regulator
MPRVGLTPDAVVDQALAVVDDSGIEALSLAAVAARAGVAPPSLYKHVSSLHALRELMADRIMRQITATFAEAIMGRSRDEAVEALMRAYRAFVKTHPGRYELVPADPLHHPGLAGAATAMLGVFVAVMRGYDMGEADSTHAIRRLRAAVHGFADLEARGGFGMAADVEATFDQVILMVLRSLR